MREPFSAREQPMTLGDIASVAITLLLVAAGTCLLVLVTGCSTAPVPKIQTVEVKVPVAVQPIAPSQVPPPPPPLPKRPDSLSAAADTLLAQVCALEGYVLRADPLLRLSAGETPGTAPDYPECREK